MFFSGLVTYVPHLFILFNRNLIVQSCFKAFVEDYVEFKLKIDDLDRRLAAIICQAFDDCSGVESAFKVNDSLLNAIFSVLECILFSM